MALNEAGMMKIWGNRKLLVLIAAHFAPAVALSSREQEVIGIREGRASA